MGALPLRAFWPDDLPDNSGRSSNSKSYSTLHGGMTLRQLYEASFRRWASTRAKKPCGELTLEMYVQTIDKWEKLTRNPPLNRIDEEILADFRVAFLEQAGRFSERMSPANVKKHLSNLRAMLRYAGPKGSRNKHGRGILEEILDVEMPDVPAKSPDGDYSLEDIGRMIGHCRSFKLPKIASTEVDATKWWRAIILCFCYLGFRLKPMTLLEFSWLRPDPTSGGGEIVLPDRVQKMGVPQWQFVHPAAWEAIETIRSDRRWIFPFGLCQAESAKQRKNARRYLGQKHVDYLELANVRKREGDNFHGYRKSHATELGMINPLAAQLSLNHASGTVMSRHYTNPRRILRDAILKMPAPVVPKTDDGQMRLF